MLCKDKADLRDKVVCHGKVVSIMIGFAESDCRFQLLIFRTDIL